MRFFSFDVILKVLKDILFWLCIATLGFYILVYGWYGVSRKYIYPLKYKDEIVYYADINHINRALVFAVVRTESKFKENAESDKGAMGLMQITPATAEYIKSLKGDIEYDMFNAENNIEYGCYYLRYLMDKFVDVEVSLCAYNAGEGKVISWLQNSEYSVDGRMLKVIPIEQTREYVKKIKKSFEKYIKLYGNILDKK